MHKSSIPCSCKAQPGGPRELQALLFDILALMSDAAQMEPGSDASGLFSSAVVCQLRDVANHSALGPDQRLLIQRLQSQWTRTALRAYGLVPAPAAPQHRGTIQ